MYAKLPEWFTVPTPLGHYNPDSAVLLTSEEGERPFFVAETKGSLKCQNCARQGPLQDPHKVGEPPARYEVVTSVEELLARIGAGCPSHSRLCDLPSSELT